MLAFSYSIICAFFFDATATTEIYTLSLHDALPIYASAGLRRRGRRGASEPRGRRSGWRADLNPAAPRSEEDTYELQSPVHLVCRLLLEKKKKTDRQQTR